MNFRVVMYLLLFELLFKDITITETMTIINKTGFFFRKKEKKKKMDKIIFHVPYEKMITLRYLFRKEEEYYCSLSGSYSFEIMTRHFFQRINDLEKIVTEESEFNSEKKETEKILNYIKVFKQEHYRNVMENNIYSNMLYFSKKDSSFGFLGWVPKFKKTYLISLKDFDYDKKKKYCHLTEKEEKFNFEYVQKFDFLSLFFKDEYFFDDRYNIPTSDIINFKRKYFNEIRNKCCRSNFVCPSDNLCRGHKFINFVEKFFEAITHCVVEEKIFYRYFLFNNFKKNNKEISGWDFTPAGYKDLSNLTYSKRLQYLR